MPPVPRGEREAALAALADACEKAALALRRAARASSEDRAEAEREAEAAPAALAEARSALARLEEADR